jgi:hypothetical protein
VHPARLSRYSVPTRLIGTTVTLVQDTGRLLISNRDPLSGRRLPARPPDDAIVLEERYCGPRPAPYHGPIVRNVVGKPFCELGEPAEQS